jgi:hypothetical protein
MPPPALPRLLLCFLLPALLSAASLHDWDTEAARGWTRWGCRREGRGVNVGFRYWIVLSFGLLGEFLLDQLAIFRQRPRLGAAYKILKISFVLWCLAPVTYNGSDIAFDHALGPLVKLGREVFRQTARLVSYAAPIVLDKLFEHAEEVWNVLECAFDLARDEACKLSDLLNKNLRDLICSEIFKKTAFVFIRKIRQFGTWTGEMVVASHAKSLEFLTKGTRKDPRLISTLVKGLILGREEEKPKRLMFAWFKGWRTVSV